MEFETLSKAVPPREARDYALWLFGPNHPLCHFLVKKRTSNVKTGLCDKHWVSAPSTSKIGALNPYLLGRTRQGARARALDGAQVEPLEFVWLEGRVRVGIWERATFGVGVRS